MTASPGARDKKNNPISPGDIIHIANAKSRHRVIGIHPTRANIIWIETESGSIPADSTVFDSRVAEIAREEWIEGHTYVYKPAADPTRARRIHVAKVFEFGDAIAYWYEGNSAETMKAGVLTVEARSAWKETG